MASDLDPDAPVFTPPMRSITKPPSQGSTPSNSPRALKEPQCSRYSRRSGRHLLNANSPRPILGNKLPFPRPILGRKDEPIRDEADEFIGREFRNLNRSFQRIKIKEEVTTSKQREDSLS